MIPWPPVCPSMRLHSNILSTRDYSPAVEVGQRPTGSKGCHNAEQVWGGRAQHIMTHNDRHITLITLRYKCRGNKQIFFWGGSGANDHVRPKPSCVGQLNVAEGQGGGVRQWGGVASGYRRVAPPSPSREILNLELL